MIHLIFSGSIEGDYPLSDDIFALEPGDTLQFDSSFFKPAIDGDMPDDGPYRIIGKSLAAENVPSMTFVLL